MSSSSFWSLRPEFMTSFMLGIPSPPGKSGALLRELLPLGEPGMPPIPSGRPKLFSDCAANEAVWLSRIAFPRVPAKMVPVTLARMKPKVPTMRSSVMIWPMMFFLLAPRDMRTPIS